mmetsp:Transcript_31981/g.62935  ORF Transcript_31981/g.62935 Transcript_31981/m.62935 type:complete len:545 (+) Transcript_31981:93-1727(+)
MAPKAKTRAKSKGGARTKAKAGASRGARAAGSGHVAASVLHDKRQKPLTHEEKSAVRLQAASRGFLVRRRLPQVREERRLYDEQVADAIREAQLAVLNIERRKAEAEQDKAEQRRKKAKKLAQDTKLILEAAYEGRSSDVQKLLEGGLPTTAHNQNGITALSEAASGGSVEVVLLLLQRKSHPNCRGEFQRTPLWRAAYAGHSEVVQILLEHGGDPRLHDDQACTPVDVAKVEDVVAKLRAWDVEETEELVAEYEFWCEAERLQQQRSQQEAMQSIDADFEQATAVHEAAQASLARAKRAFREREKEHGLGLASGHEAAIMACASASDHLEAAEAAASAAQAKLDKASLQRLRAAECCGASVEALPGRNIFIPDLNNVLIRDLGGSIAHGSRWPIVIDPSECANKMLQYAGCSVLCFWRADHMIADRIRKSLLFMIRGGGVLAVDLHSFSGGVDLELLAEPFEQVRPGLFADIMSRTLLSPPPGKHKPRFFDLVQHDEKHFSIEHFDERCTNRFKFLVLSAAESPNRQLLDAFDALRVQAPGQA